MLRDKRQEYLVALLLVGPFVLIYGALFVWPTIQM
ncbi:MAG: sugar ABC transporter permease, partial [Hyphomicrobiales bacterium]